VAGQLLVPCMPNFSSEEMDESARKPTAERSSLEARFSSLVPSFVPKSWNCPPEPTPLRQDKNCATLSFSAPRLRLPPFPAPCPALPFI